MRTLNIALQPIIETLKDLSGEELRQLAVEELKQFNIAEEERKKKSELYFKRKAVISNLLLQKCIDDTGNHEWVKDSYAYSPSYCKKCYCEK